MTNNNKERKFMIAATKLLDRVRFENSWSQSAFREAAKHIVDINQAQAARLQQTMLEMKYLVPGTNKRKLSSNFDVSYFKNTDACLGFIREILEVNPDILQEPGPKPSSKGIPIPSQDVSIAEVSIDLSTISTDDLILEICTRDLVENPKWLIDFLRDNGWVITCAREKKIIETI
jgi:hypothetical protein